MPLGSGLGTSSILAGTVLAALGKAMGRTYSPTSLCHLVLIVEQMLTTGGGWQDQVGGLWPGVKTSWCASALPVVVRVFPIAPGLGGGGGGGGDGGGGAELAAALTPPTGILPLTGFVMGAWVVRVHGTTDAGVLAGAVAGVEPDGADGTGAVTVMDRALVATLPPESVTSTVIGATCAVVGVPEITPVAVLSVSPAGRDPLVSAHDE